MRGNQVQPSSESEELVSGDSLSSYSLSEDFGLGIATPLPKKKAQNRFGRSADESAFAMASSHGKANERPAPRRNVRRSRCQERRAIVKHLPLESVDQNLANSSGDSDHDDISKHLRFKAITSTERAHSGRSTRPGPIAG